MQRFGFALLAVFVALFLPLATYASTITLTGSCPTYVIQGRQGNITFNLLAAGNGSVANMTIAPFVEGASIQNPSAYFPIVSPGTEYSRGFYVYNTVANGSYVVNFASSYTQDANRFSTVFACLIYVGGHFQGPLTIQAGFHNNKVSTNVSNIAGDQILAKEVVIAPPGFSVPSPVKNITVGAYATDGESFSLGTPNYTQASFPVLAELSYEYNGFHFAGIGTAIVEFGGAGKSGSDSSSLVTWAFVAILVVLVLLIAFSLLKRNKNKTPKPEEAVK